MQLDPVKHGAPAYPGASPRGPPSEFPIASKTQHSKHLPGDSEHSAKNSKAKNAQGKFNFC